MLCAFTNGMSMTRGSLVLNDITPSYMKQTEAMSSSSYLDDICAAVLPITIHLWGKENTAEKLTNKNMQCTVRPQIKQTTPK